MTSVGADLQRAWTFLFDENNRAVVGWMGAGLLAAIIGILKVIRSRRDSAGTIVSASNGVAAGRNVSKNNITITRLVTQGEGQEDTRSRSPGSRPPGSRGTGSRLHVLTEPTG
jgi:hypothetical protein